MQVTSISNVMYACTVINMKDCGAGKRNVQGLMEWNQKLEWDCSPLEEVATDATTYNIRHDHSLASY